MVKHVFVYQIWSNETLDYQLWSNFPKYHQILPHMVKLLFHKIFIYQMLSNSLDLICILSIMVKHYFHWQLFILFINLQKKLLRWFPLDAVIELNASWLGREPTISLILATM